MPTTLPNSLALQSIVAGSQITSAPHRTNYTDIQTAVNTLITALSGGTAGQKLQAASATSVEWAGGGAAITGSHLRKTTQKDVVNTAAKTDLFNAEITIPASALTSTGIIVISAGGDYLNNSGASRTLTPELKLGSQVLWDGGASESFAASATRRSWHMFAVIQALASLSAQSGDGAIFFSTPTAATTGAGRISATSSDALWCPFDTVQTTVDMTANQALTFSITHSAANASLSMRLDRASVLILNA